MMSRALPTSDADLSKPFENPPSPKRFGDDLTEHTSLRLHREVIPSLGEVVRQIASRVAVIVFGKRLRNGKLTREGRARCDYLLHVIDRGHIPADGVLVFSGQDGEALLMQSYFLERVGAVTHWMPRIFLEPHARYTRENVEFSLQLLEEHEIPFDVVYCISTNYHLEREQAIDVMAPEVSDLRRLRERYPAKPVTLLGAPYPFANFPDETVLWLASIYRVSTWWSPLEVMLRGLKPPHGVAAGGPGGQAGGQTEPAVKHIRGDAVRLLEISIEYLDRLERRPPKQGSDRHLNDAVDRIMTSFRKYIEELAEMARRLEKALDDRPEMPADFTTWADAFQTLHDAKHNLQHAADPDYLVA